MSKSSICFYLFIISALVYFMFDLALHSGPVKRTEMVQDTPIVYFYEENRPYTNNRGGIDGYEFYACYGVIKNNHDVKKVELTTEPHIKVSKKGNFKRTRWERSFSEDGSYWDGEKKTTFFLTPETLETMIR